MLAVVKLLTTDTTKILSEHTHATGTHTVK